jgi:hypothetical protein
MNLLAIPKALVASISPIVIPITRLIAERIC